MRFYWHNEFNGIEKDGPFESAELAKQHAVEIYRKLQSGFAFAISIRGDDDTIEYGHINGGKWIDGDYEEGEPRCFIGEDA